MTHPFEIAQDLEVGATPEQVWDAIATGEGQDSWFMGRNTVEPREGWHHDLQHRRVHGRVHRRHLGSSRIGS